MLTLFQRLKKRIYFYLASLSQSSQSLILISLFALAFEAKAQTIPAPDLFTASSSITDNKLLPNSVSKEEGQILVFISSSMPASSLAQWFSQAQHWGATVVIRGFVNNSLFATKAWLKPLIEHTQLESGVEINPVAFEAFSITQVPAVVVSIGKLQCLSNQPCTPSPFDIVSGNASLYEALKMIAEKGGVGIAFAKQTLARMKEAM